MTSTPLPRRGSPGGAAEHIAAPRARRTVDAPIRTFHALFALSFLGAYLTAEGESMRLLHVTLGYTMAGLLAFRLVYGVVGPRQARLSMLWRKVRGAPPWLMSVWRAAMGTSKLAIPWRQGQNLLLATAVVTLLAMVVPLTVSGYGAYNEWGDWLSDVHEGAGDVLLALVLVHIGVVALFSLLRRQNLAAPMVHGRMAGPGPDLVQRNHLWLAVLLCVAVLAFWGWEWQQSPNGLVSAQADARTIVVPMRDAHPLV